LAGEVEEAMALSVREHAEEGFREGGVGNGGDGYFVLVIKILKPK
jgi:hypothetical protein